MEYKLTMRSEMDTIELAQNIESEKFPNMVICLNGELGSGKTVFTKGFANALGIDENVRYDIVQPYIGASKCTSNCKSRHNHVFNNYCSKLL